MLNVFLKSPPLVLFNDAKENIWLPLKVNDLVSFWCTWRCQEAKELPLLEKESLGRWQTQLMG